MLKRTYQETVSDVIEAGFSFRGISIEDFSTEKKSGKETQSEALEKAITLEEKAIRFYSDAADQSKSLLAHYSPTA